jgi:peptidoglycan hydrolase CwlO-like protein
MGLKNIKRVIIKLPILDFVVSNYMKKIFFKIVFFLISSLAVSATLGVAIFTARASSLNNSSGLQSQIDQDNQQIITLNQKINEYEVELKQAGTDKKTLQSAIAILDLQRNEVQAQVSVIQSQINTTQLQIQQLGSQILDAQQNIAAYQNSLALDLVAIYQSDNQPLLYRLLSSGSLSGFWQNYDATVQVQNAIKSNAEQLQTEENTLTTTQSAVQQKKDDLTAQNQSLNSQQQTLGESVESKNQLLAETKNKESNYQKLLAQAEQELQSFSKFTQNAGGDQLLPNETACDSWGCYYNQRDESWGQDSLDGTNYSLASDGCLVTSMAMVMTHYGYRSVTPKTINSNPANFAAYYPAFLLYTINVDGVTAMRVDTDIDTTLATGNPVIIGMNAYGGTHFIVLVSGSKGNYIMRDPYVANGKDINFASYYNLGEIYSITKVSISS